MRRVALADVASDDPGDESDRHHLASALGTESLALTRYRIAPGDGLPGGVHAHTDQEEVFVVLDGTVTFETPAAADGRVAVSAGEAIRFAPGEFQSGWNRGESDCTVLALGAPRDSDDTRIPVACPDCDHPDLRLDVGGDAPTLVCPACAAEHVPEPCPACGDGELVARLDGHEAVVVCESCASEFADPPFRGRVD
ncbi:cupin domain-containing protein [Haloarchaeobius sp. DT45]|uniref:cupin domain-containing protein n=1 Tax=Haloarchaeobius sp. DT45 TaxID=3446116 RepID=UPI003F6B607E